MVENHHAAVILTDTATAKRSVFFFSWNHFCITRSTEETINLQLKSWWCDIIHSLHHAEHLFFHLEEKTCGPEPLCSSALLYYYNPVLSHILSFTLSEQILARRLFLWFGYRTRPCCDFDHISTTVQLLSAVCNHLTFNYFLIKCLEEGQKRYWDQTPPPWLW